VHLFDRDVLLNETGPLRYKGAVSENWSVNGIPNGGFLLALLANAMAMNSEKRATPIVTANYLSRSAIGDAELRVDRISQSVQFNRLQASLSQGGTERVRGIGTFADEKIECVLERYETAAPHVAPLDVCLPFPKLPKFTLLDNLDIRLDPDCAGWFRGILTDKSELRGWIRFRDDRPFDLISLFLLADAFPPAVFASQGMAAWVPTIEMSVNVRMIPETMWLKGRFRTRFITCGLMEEDGELWDEEGNLAAISRQIAQYRKAAS
jgi:hypothetical protein